MSELACFGGAPVRQKPFLTRPMVDGEEERFLLEAVRNDNFSRYIGSAYPDLERQLRMTSAEAMSIDDYWSFLGGPNVRAFAAEWSAKMNVSYCIPINSATSGLSVALAACGIGPGDEVIVPAISFSATAMAVLAWNAIPVFVDVDPHTFCMDPEAVERAITPSTRAILCVHLAGNMVDMDAILAIAKRHNLRVVEDACQAIGARWRGRYSGTIGDAGVFSLQQSKNIMTGEGGMVVTNDPEVARKCRLILNHGECAFDETHGPDDLANIVGLNFRLPELCAAVGRAQIAKLDAVNGWRTRNADYLRRELAGLPGLDIPVSQRAGSLIEDVPHFFVLLHDEAGMGISRDLFTVALRAEGVPVGTGYVRTLYENPVFMQKIAYGSKGCPWTCGHYQGDVTYAKGQCPTAEALLEKRFLWFYHISYASTEEDMADIVRAVRKVVDRRVEIAENAARLSNQLGFRSQGRLGIAPAQMRGR